MMALCVVANGWSSHGDMDGNVHSVDELSTNQKDCGELKPLSVTDNFMDPVPPLAQEVSSSYTPQAPNTCGRKNDGKDQSYNAHHETNGESQNINEPLDISIKSSLGDSITSVTTTQIQDPDGNDEDHYTTSGERQNKSVNLIASEHLTQDQDTHCTLNTAFLDFVRTLSIGQLRDLIYVADSSEDVIALLEARDEYTVEDVENLAHCLLVAQDKFKDMGFPEQIINGIHDAYSHYNTNDTDIPAKLYFLAAERPTEY